MAPSNVLFALLRDQSLIQLVQDAETGIWNPQRITLPTTDADDMVEATTFTTQVKCTNQNGMPAIGSSVLLESKERVSLTINNTYRKISPDSPIEVKADGTGSITIVQETDALPAVCFKLSCGDQTLQVDPQSKIAKNLSAVKSRHDLNNVRIPDSDGNMKPLVPDDVPDDERDSIAKFLPKLLEARSSLPIYGSLDTATLMNTTKATGEVGFWGVVRDSGKLRFCEGKDVLVSLSGHLSPAGYSTLASPSLLTSAGITTASGDLFQFLKDVWEDVQHFWIKAVDGFTQFIAVIGGKIYTVILDSVRAVSSAIEFVFKKIKVFFDDLVAWLGFLFNWGDILRTHRVIKNVFKQYA